MREVWDTVNIMSEPIIIVNHLLAKATIDQRRARDWTLRRLAADWLTEPVDSDSHVAAGALLAAGRTKCRIYSGAREGHKWA